MLAQAVILCGGLGTRLGELTASTPKPMLPVAGRPFLEHLIQETARFGVERILLLAGRFGEQVAAAYHGARRYGADIAVLVEPEPLGTGGALRFARNALDPTFMLLNGDSWIDADLTRFMADWEARRRARPQVKAALLLQHVDDAGRYGSVTAADGMVVAFAEKTAGASGRPGLINAGVYIIDRSVVDALPARGAASLEKDVLPGLASAGAVVAHAAQPGRFFIDIGVPETFAAAERGLQRARTRPALFLDRDGTLNVDAGYTHRPGDLQWNSGAREAIRWANDHGYFVFVVTNQAGVARGYYDGAAVLAFHRAMQRSLFEIGAHIDAIEWCPHHPEGTVAAFSHACRRRKPEPGMLLDLMAQWPVDRDRSLMVGDRESDMQAGAAAGVATALYTGGSLLELVRDRLAG
ncbi:HAD-IIIA family hydrolase [Camelimonas abortus]|uniref:D,D-heptose 1,7-bisphosphate phosphatase n=1 Tax=Camelimonas abortus TaxID=1017184 RepID=A0ABV7LEN3_9HYPH